MSPSWTPTPQMGHCTVPGRFLSSDPPGVVDGADGWRLPSFAWICRRRRFRLRRRPGPPRCRAPQRRFPSQIRLPHRHPRRPPGSRRSQHRPPRPCRPRPLRPPCRLLKAASAAAARREARIGRPHAPPPDVEASRTARRPRARSGRLLRFRSRRITLCRVGVSRSATRGSFCGSVVRRGRPVVVGTPRVCFVSCVPSRPGGAATALGIGSSTRRAPASSRVRAALYAPTTASSA